MRRSALLFFLCAFCAPTLAFGDVPQLDEEARLKDKMPPNISNDMLDPKATSRLHLTTRFTFSTPDEVFSDEISRTAITPQAHFRVADKWAVNIAVPFGNTTFPTTDDFFIGNIRFGASTGFEVRLQPERRTKRSARFRLGFGLDVYVPSAQAPSDDLRGQAILLSVAQLTSFEPELYIGDAMFFRGRGLAELSFDFLSIEAEMGFSPGFTIEDDSEAQLLVAWAGRIAFKPTFSVEPYVEIGSSFHVVGQEEQNLRDFDTPVWVTPGVRLHLDWLDPAIFASFNLDEFGVMFGVDLAGAVRELIRDRMDGDFMEDIFPD